MQIMQRKTIKRQFNDKKKNIQKFQPGQMQLDSIR